MGKRIMMAVLVAAIAVGFLSPPTMAAPKKITVAYFPGWPCTFQVGWAKGWFEEEMGVEVNFREFDTGAAITTAMASGHVHIGFSVGSSPSTAAVTQGVPIKFVAVAVGISGDAENLVARSGTGIKTPGDLAGKKVGVPFGTNPHFKLMGLLEIFRIDPKKVEIIDMAPQDLVAAFKRKDVDAALAWEPFYSEFLESDGHRVLSGDTLDMWGYSTFDTVAVNKAFAEDNPDLLIKFLKVVDKSTIYFRQHPDESYRLIAEKAGITPEKTKSSMANMRFYTAAEQLTPAWMGTVKQPGDVPNKIQRLAAFLVDQKAIDKALDDYSLFVDSSYLERVVQDQ